MRFTPSEGRYFPLFSFDFLATSSFFFFFSFLLKMIVLKKIYSYYEIFYHDRIDLSSLFMFLSFSLFFLNLIFIVICFWNLFYLRQIIDSYLSSFQNESIRFFFSQLYFCKKRKYTNFLS